MYSALKRKHLVLDHKPHLFYFYAGAKKLIHKIKDYRPKIAVFNGKGIYEVFSGQKQFIFGKQPEKIQETDTVSFRHLLAGVFL